MYVLRHGTTGKIWMLGCLWLWPSIAKMKKAWKDAQAVGLVSSDFNKHKIVAVIVREINDE